MKNCATRQEREERCFDLNIGSGSIALCEPVSRSECHVEQAMTQISCFTRERERERERERIRQLVLFLESKKKKNLNIYLATLQNRFAGLRRGFLYELWHKFYCRCSIQCHNQKNQNIQPAIV
ncbi:MAG: hypothetical protein LBD59_08560 [Prevotellaceae bacterium]|nr:hypothetical protein [Prevotellaceae bacterium]